MHHWPDLPRSVAESMGHPIMGYVGAFLGVYVADKFAEIKLAGIPKKIAIAVGAFAVNLSAETMQAIISPGSPYTNFVSEANLPETTKDLAFAGLGAVLFYWQTRNVARVEASAAAPFDWQSQVPELDYRFDTEGRQL